MPDKITIVALAAYYIGSAAVSSMPPPTASSGPWYEWFYKFSNTLCANVTAIRGKAMYEPKMQVVRAESSSSSATLSLSAEEPKP